MRYLFFIFLFFILWRDAQSQSLIRQADGLYDFKQYTLAEGFIGSVVEHVFQDSKGHVWCATRSGLNRITGNQIIHYDKTDGLPEDDVKCVVEDVDGFIWVGTEKGLSRFDGHQFLNYIDSLKYPQIWALIAHPEGGVLIGTLGGVDHIYKGSVKHFLDIDTINNKGNWVRSLNYDSDGKLWVGTANGMYKVLPDSVEKIIGLGHALGWAQQSDGTIWVSGWNKYVFRLKNGNIDKFEVSSPVNSIKVNKLDEVWFGTWEKGLLRWDGEGFVQYDVLNGLPSNTVWNLCVDNENSLWCGTYDGGVCRLNNPEFSIYDKLYGLKTNVIHSVLDGDFGSLWAATDVGIVKIDSAGKIKTWTTKEGLVSNKVHALLKTGIDEIWFVLYAYRNGNGKIVKDELSILPYGGGHSICKGVNESIWIGTDGDGVRIIEDGKLVKSLNIGGVRERVYSLGVDSEKNTWIGIERRGFSVYKDDSLYSLISPMHLEGVSGLEIKMDFKENVWVRFSGRNYGLYQVHFEDGGIKIIDSIGESEIKSKARISAFLPDGNNMWITTDEELIKMSLSDFYGEKKSIRLKFWKQKDGFIGEGCKEIVKTKDGRVVIASNKGIIIYHENQGQKTQCQPFTELTEVKLFKKHTDWAKMGMELRKNYPVPEKLNLEYFNNYLTFNFNGVSHSSQGNIFYRYYLEGFDSRWSPISSVDEATYSNLPPGKYLFKVQCKNKEGVWDDSPDQIFVVIGSPYWELLWFKGVVFIAIILFIVFLVRMRVRKLKKDKQKLAQIVNLRTEELLNSNAELEEKNKEILDSINYAKRIQTAILPSLKIVKEYLQDSFILYKPKDIVAGDFYWFDTVKMDNSNKSLILFAAADCTGHGVPGAMVSLVCNNALNRSVREFGLTKPGEILDRTREIVIREFDKSEEEVKDGMDIALCSLSGNVLEYAGANNPLWIIRNKSQEVEVVKANKEPIGIFDRTTPYKTTCVKLEKGDTIYIFSDGFIDQFGGEKGKKFKTVNFKKLLLSVQECSMECQLNMLNEAFEKWRDKVEQIDDVCVIGVKIDTN